MKTVKEISTKNLESIYNSFSSLQNNEVSKAKERIKKLKKLKKNIINYSGEIKKALFKDFKKNPSEVDITEIFPVTSEINHTINNLSKWMRDEPVGTPITLIGSRSYIKYEPKGLVLIITPWNFPINLTFVSLINAISAGNSAIIKPSEITHNTSIIIKEIIEKTFKNDEVTTVLGGAETAKKLLKLKFNHILFIGSPTIGKIVMKSASKFLASVTLELGGKSPTIIDNSYILINKSIKEEFIKLLCKEIEKLYSNKSIKSDSYCRIVSKNHFERINNLLEDAIKKGAKILIGGKVDKNDNFIEPTVIDNVNHKSKIHDEEIFGPILPVYEYNNIDEAINFINQKEKPLAIYLFSNSNKNIDRILKRTSSGGICINHSTLHYSNYNLPFGGINNSGFGRCHGIYGFKEFSNIKSVFRQYLPFSPTDLLVPPYTRFKKIIIKYLLKYF